MVGITGGVGVLDHHFVGSALTAVATGKNVGGGDGAEPAGDVKIGSGFVAGRPCDTVVIDRDQDAFGEPGACRIQKGKLIMGATISASTTRQNPNSADVRVGCGHRHKRVRGAIGPDEVKGRAALGAWVGNGSDAIGAGVGLDGGCCCQARVVRCTQAAIACLEPDVVVLFELMLPVEVIPGASVPVARSILDVDFVELQCITGCQRVGVGAQSKLSVVVMGDLSRESERRSTEKTDKGAEKNSRASHETIPLALTCRLASAS